MSCGRLRGRASLIDPRPLAAYETLKQTMHADRRHAMVQNERGYFFTSRLSHDCEDNVRVAHLGELVDDALNAIVPRVAARNGGLCAATLAVHWG